jgi:hypothetical protein
MIATAGLKATVIQLLVDFVLACGSEQTTAEHTG